MCTPLYAVQGTDPQMSFEGEPTHEWDQRQVNANEVQATMQHIHEPHLRVEMRGRQAVQEEGANRARIPVPNILEGSKVWLDTRQVWTTMPTWTLDWKRLGPFMVVHRVSPYAYELELPASIRIRRVQPVSLLDGVVNDSLEGQLVNPPPPVEVDGEEEYMVWSVEDSRMYWNQLQ